MRKNKTIARKQKREDLKLHGISVPHHTKKKVKYERDIEIEQV